MPNPKAPRRARQASETQSELTQFLDRLRQLGADDDELTTVAAHWDEFDEDWTREKRAETLRLTDDELRAGLLSARDEYMQSTLDEQQQRDAERAAQLDHAVAEARDRIGLSVQNVLEWVGGEPVRAQAVLQVENEAAVPRRTLVEPLQAMLNADAASS